MSTENTQNRIEESIKMRCGIGGPKGPLTPLMILLLLRKRSAVCGDCRPRCRSQWLAASRRLPCEPSSRQAHPGCSPVGPVRCVPEYRVGCRQHAHSIARLDAISFNANHLQRPLALFRSVSRSGLEVMASGAGTAECPVARKVP